MPASQSYPVRWIAVKEWKRYLRHFGQTIEWHEKICLINEHRENRRHRKFGRPKFISNFLYEIRLCWFDTDNTKIIFKTMQGRFRHWLTPGVQLVKRSRDWSGKVKQQERLGLGGGHWVTQPKPPLLFHFSAIIALFTITLCFTNWMSGTGYLGNNHNHYTFFKCDWCMSCFNFLLLILYSCNWN